VLGELQFLFAVLTYQTGSPKYGFVDPDRSPKRQKKPTKIPSPPVGLVAAWKGLNEGRCWMKSAPASAK